MEAQGRGRGRNGGFGGRGGESGGVWRGGRGGDHHGRGGESGGVWRGGRGGDHHGRGGESGGVWRGGRGGVHHGRGGDHGGSGRDHSGRGGDHGGSGRDHSGRGGESGDGPWWGGRGGDHGGSERGGDHSGRGREGESAGGGPWRGGRGGDHGGSGSGSGRDHSGRGRGGQSAGGGPRWERRGGDHGGSGRGRDHSERGRGGESGGGGGAWCGRGGGGGPPPASCFVPLLPSDLDHLHSCVPLPSDCGHVHAVGPTPSGPGSSVPQSSKSKPSEENTPISNRHPIDRPDSGGTSKSRQIRLFANHFLVDFDCNATIFHYDVSIAPVNREGGEGSSSGSELKARVSKSDSRLIARKVFAENPALFSTIKFGYDGQKSMYTKVQLQEGSYTVKLSKGDESDAREYKCTLKLAARADLIHLRHYLERSTATTIESTIQALEVVMREHPTNSMIARGRNFYSMKRIFDLGSGVGALRGFFQSLRPTVQGLILNVDFSAMAFYKSISVLDFLNEYAPDLMQRAWSRINDFDRRCMERILKGLKVRVTHRKSTDTFTIFGLSKRSAREETFELTDQKGKFRKGKGTASTGPARMMTPSPAKVTIENYFYDQYKKEIRCWYLPCLNFSKKSTNYVPMEFCMLVEGQKFSMDNLPEESLKELRNMTNLTPANRYNSIEQIVAAEEGPWGGDVAAHFGLSGSRNLTDVQGRILNPPELKVGPANRKVRLDPNCQWNLMNCQLYDPKPIDCWAVVGFLPQNQMRNTREISNFAQELVGRCSEIGVKIKRDPLDLRCEDINCLSDQARLRGLLTNILAKAGNQLQLLVCVIAFKHSGYKVLKLISETEVGVMTQCVLGKNLRKGSQYLANLALKINAKVGGSNVALCSAPRARCIGKDVHVMFMGADVNHPSPGDRISPSIAAVVATMNWPAANIYEAKLRSQNNRKEKIVNLGEMCIELVHMYHKNNGKFPEKIVFFRDGVSEGQFNMVLNEELDIIKMAFSSIGYNPSITLIIAQKRHRTRLFPVSPSDGTKHGNVPPGTIVDTKIVHVREFDFFLCSHYGLLGTSKPTHYHVLWDENKFSSDELQEVVYNLCFTFARCTKPVSLVPPVYYADLVAYRGRLYYEGWLESHSSLSTSSSTSQGFDHETFPKLHCNVEHNMFFG